MMFEPEQRLMSVFATGDEWLAGGRFTLVEPNGDHVDRLTVMYPTLMGNVSQGFPLVDALPWSALSVGEHRETTTRSKAAYTVRVGRPGDAVWLFSIRRTESERDPIELDRARIRLLADVPSPPWEILTLSFEGSTPRGSVEGELELRRIH